ncbi:MAG: hypothetical protein ACREI3_08340, partial [Nitrospirales bacterium]
MHAVTPAATPTPVAPCTAEIVVLRYLDQPFTYTVPAHLHDGLDIGSLVLVPFGSTRVPGVVVARGFSAAVRPGEQPIHPARLREVLRPIVGRSGAPLLLPEPLLTLTRWVADQYLTPWGQVLRIALPAFPQSTKSSRYVLMDDGQRQGAALRMRSVAARQVVARLAGRANGLTGATLRRTLPGLQARTLRDLVRRGVIQELEAPPSERPSHAPSPGRARASTPEEAVLGCPEPASLSGPTDTATFETPTCETPTRETPTREAPTRHILERATQDRPGVLVL